MVNCKNDKNIVQLKKELEIYWDYTDDSLLVSVGGQSMIGDDLLNWLLDFFMCFAVFIFLFI